MPDPSSYRSRLSPWCIIQHLPNMRHQIIARHRKRPDAEAQLRLLRQLSPSQTYELMFDPPYTESQLDPPIDRQSALQPAVQHPPTTI